MFGDLLNVNTIVYKLRKGEKTYITPSTKPLPKPRPTIQHRPINHHHQKRKRRHTRIKQRMQPSKHAGQFVQNHTSASRRIQQRMHRRHSKVEPHTPEIQKREETKRLPNSHRVVVGGVVDEDVYDTEKDVDGDYGADQPQKNGWEQP